MDEREKHFIRANLPQLIRTTRYSVQFAAILHEHGVFGDGDNHAVLASLGTDGEFGAVLKLLNILTTRVGAFDVLLGALKATGQSGAAVLLETFKQSAYATEPAPAWQEEAGTSGTPSKNKNSLDEVNDPDFQLALDFIGSVRKLDIKVERPHTTSDNNLVDPKMAYVLPNGRRGLALILNIVEFENKRGRPRVHNAPEMPGVSKELLWSRRNGSEVDVEYLSKLLLQLDYEIYPTDETLRESKSKTLKEMQEFIREFKDKCNEIKPKSIIVFVGTHGFHPMQLVTSDTKTFPPRPEVKLDIFEDVVFEFSDENCPGLKGKPKIFLIQACQKFLPRERTEQDSATESRSRYMKDTIIYTAGMPGETVNRDIHKGSWFIHCFTYILMKHAKDVSFQDIMKKVKIMMKMIKSTCKQEHEMMSYKFMSKKVYFSLNQ